MSSDGNPSTMRRRVWFKRQGRAKVATPRPRSEPRVLKVSKLMALVIRYDQLLEAGHVKNRAELSQLAEVSSARLTQIMNLLLLAPDIQDEILSLPCTTARVDPISDRCLRAIVAEPNWEKQRVLWKQLLDTRI